MNEAWIIAIIGWCIALILGIFNLIQNSKINKLYIQITKLKTTQKQINNQSQSVQEQWNIYMNQPELIKKWLDGVVEATGTG